MNKKKPPKLVLVIFFTLVAGFPALLTTKFYLFWNLKYLASDVESKIMLDGNIFHDRNRFVDDLNEGYLFEEQSSTKTIVDYDVSIHAKEREKHYRFSIDSIQDDLIWINIDVFGGYMTIGYMRTDIFKK